jgi:hypothetical protein
LIRRCTSVAALFQACGSTGSEATYRPALLRRAFSATALSTSSWSCHVVEAWSASYRARRSGGSWRTRESSSSW